MASSDRTWPATTSSCSEARFCTGPNTRNRLAASADLKTFLRRGYVASGTPEQAQFALAFLLALAQEGTVTADASDDGLTLQVMADKATLQEEVRKALWPARQWVHQTTGMLDDDGTVSVEVRIAPLRRAKRKKPKAASPARKGKAAKRKRRA